MLDGSSGNLDLWTPFRAQSGQADRPWLGKSSMIVSGAEVGA
jgi:hypothetical protein